MALTAKQEAFCLEYLIDLNATQAAIRAGYSEASAHVEGSRLLSNAKVRTRVREMMDLRSEETLVDAHFVIESLIENVKRCQTAEQVMEWDYEEKCMKPTGEWQFDSQGANRALELLGKHIGMFEKDNNQKRINLTQELIIKGQKFAGKS